MNNEAENFVLNTSGVYAIFLFQGLSAYQKHKLRDSFGGQIGLASWIAEFAPIVDTFVLNDSRTYPGVYAYEIVEGMGLWLGDNPEATVLEFETELKRRTDAWVSQSSLKGETL